ncbi:MAG: hypothetical protein NTW05_10930 [Pseudonocardiales bacterium]|jgi:hypothetical protein|nr:hypothetical protein [Pseudonocardiales bacterium]
MTASSSNEAWEDDIVRGLHSTTADQVPALEIILIDAVVDWLFSPANPGQGYTEEHAGHMISTLFAAVDSSRSYLPARTPPVTPELDAARARIVEGAHELSAQRGEGVSLLVSRLMPAVLAQLNDHAGEQAKQAHGIVVHLLYVLGLGTRTEHDQALIEGVVAAFAGWDAVLRDGFVPPWRPRRPEA